MQQQGSMLAHEDMSRLENLMERIEGGQPYGDQTDIDMLLEEVVKRLENRVVSKIDDMLARLQQGAPLTGSSQSQTIKKVVGSKPKAGLEPNMDLLNHEAQEIVQDVVMSSVDVAITNMADDEEDQLWKRISQTSADSSRAFQQTSQAFQQKQSPRKVTPSENKKNTKTSKPGKPRGVITTDNVDSTYTYVLRNSVRRSIPKYLEKEGKSRAAVMHMFNDIRLSMADDSLEDIIVDALRDAYLSQEGDENSIAQKKEISTPKPRSVSSPPTDRRRHDSEPQTWSRRRSSSTLPPGVRHVEAPSKGRQSTSDPVKGRQSTGDPVKGRQGTGKQKNFDVTKIRVNQDKPRQVSDGWVRQDSDSSNEDVEKFYSALDVDQFYTGADNENKSDALKEAKVITSASKKQVQFAGAKQSPSSSEDWKSAAQNMGDATLRHDSNLNYLVRRHVGRALPKFTYNQMVTRALTQLSEKLMDEIPLQPAILSLNHDDVDFTSADKNAEKGVSKPSKSGKTRDDKELPWVTKGTDQKSDKGRSKGKTSQDMPWVTKGQNVKKGQENFTVTSANKASKIADDSYDDLPWVRRGNQDDVYTTPKRTTTPGNELPSRMSIATQTSKRALNDCPGCNPQSITAGRGFNKNTNQSGDSLLLSSQNDCTEEIFYDALCETPSEPQIFADDHSEEMSKSFLKRFRLNLLFRKQQKKNQENGEEKKFVSAVHKVIEARRSGCIDDDGNFVQSIPPPSPTNDGKKSPPAVKPKPKKINQLDKNGNSVKRESGKRRGSSRRRHNPDRESYPLPEEDDGSEGYASASEMDDFNPTAFLERNRRSAENRYYREDDEEVVEDDGDDADVESDSDGLNSPNLRVRFSDDVQHFGEIVALQETESTDNLDPEDDELDISRLSLKSKIELFEKVGSNEFLDDRSYQGSPPPDLPDTSLLPTKDRVKLFEDISSGRKPTTSAANHKPPRRAVDSCQFTLTASKISFFEELSGVKRN